MGMDFFWKVFDLLVDVFELFVDVFEFLFEDVEIGEVVFDDMVFVLVELLFVVDEGFVLDVVLMDCVGFYVIVIVVDIVVMVYCKIFDGDLIIEVVEVVIFFGLEDLEIVFGDF